MITNLSIHDCAHASYGCTERVAIHETADSVRYQHGPNPEHSFIHERGFKSVLQVGWWLCRGVHPEPVACFCKEDFASFMVEELIKEFGEDAVRDELVRLGYIEVTAIKGKE